MPGGDDNGSAWARTQASDAWGNKWVNAWTGIGAFTFTYNAEGLMRTSTVSGTTTTYTYDANGRRVGKATGSAVTKYVYDVQGQLIAEFSTVPATLAGTHYVTGDYLGSTRAVTNESGNVVKRYDYTPYGVALPVGLGGRSAGQGYEAAEDPVGQAIRFTGKERDGETMSSASTRLDYFGARYLSATQGRFTSTDKPFVNQHTEDPQSWNLYAYVRNHPLRYTYPTSRCLRPNETVESCGGYLLGGLKAVGNIPSGIINASNHLANALILPLLTSSFLTPYDRPSHLATKTNDMAWRRST